MRQFTEVSIVGMHFREREGVPAKSIVANFIPPVELTLEREPENRFDAYAIKALYNGHHIGYVESAQAAYIAPWMDEGATATCTVLELREAKNNLYPIVTIELT